MPALHINLKFYYPEEKMPPFREPILVLTKTGNWIETECINDSEYGPVLNGFEEYGSVDDIRIWALLPKASEIINATQNQYTELVDHLKQQMFKEVGIPEDRLSQKDSPMFNPDRV